MSETGEMPTPQEMHAENPVVASVKGAIDKAGEDTQSFNQEYWQIRKELQGRLDWHGGGIYKLYVQNMDKVTDVVWGKGDRGWGSRIMEIKDRLWTRLSGWTIAVSSASADVVTNALTWPVRKLFPIFPVPKDPFKRLAVGLTGMQTVGRAQIGAVEVAGQVAVKAQEKVGKAGRAVSEAALTTPEVAATMAKRRVEKAMYTILHPQNTQKPPKA